jgi:membrane protein YdbS with pleckstrin-like domain
MDKDERVVKVTTIIALASVVIVAIAGITITAVLTSRDLRRAELFAFIGVLIIAALGGLSFAALKRRHWRIRVDEDDNNDDGRTRRDL